MHTDLGSKMDLVRKHMGLLEAVQPQGAVPKEATALEVMDKAKQALQEAESISKMVSF